MSITKSRAMDLRPVARAAQRPFQANQILFVIALVFGIVLGVLLVTKETDGFARTAADDTVRIFLLGGLFVYAGLFALMDYARRYWIGVALSAALVMMAIVLGTMIAIVQGSEDYVWNALAAVLVMGPLVFWFALQLAASWRLAARQ